MIGVMDDKVNLAQKFDLLEGFYKPAIVGYLNDYKLQIVKVQGPFVWHKHDDTDDFFLVIRRTPDHPPARSRHRARTR